MKLLATCTVVAAMVCLVCFQDVSATSAPSAAALLTPFGVVKTVTPMYSWNAVPNATWYRLWAMDASGKVIIDQWYKREQLGCPTGAGTCNITPIKALTYGWAKFHVLTWSEVGSGPWSDPMMFKVSKGEPMKATILAPAGPTIKATSPPFTWIPSYNATWYRLWVNDINGVLLQDQWYTKEQVSCPSGLGTCTITPSIALPHGWSVGYVGAWNEYATDTVWSDGMWFKVINP